MTVRLLDSTVLIDHLRGHRAAVGFLERAAGRGDQLWSLALVRFEVLAGMLAGEERRTFQLLDRIQWLDVTTEVADRAAELARTFRSTHRGSSPIDYLIAAGVHQLGADLATRNIRHFPMFPGLQPPY
jgi:predicted nucleic acid-binding protein